MLGNLRRGVGNETCVLALERLDYTSSDNSSCCLKFLLHPEHLKAVLQPGTTDSHSPTSYRLYWRGHFERWLRSRGNAQSGPSLGYDEKISVKEIVKS